MVDLRDAVNSQLHMSFNGVSDSEVTVDMPISLCHQRESIKGNSPPGGSQSGQKSEHKRPRVFPEPCEDSRQGSLHPHLRVCQHRKSSDYHPTKTFYHLVSERVKCSFVG